MSKSLFLMLGVFALTVSGAAAANAQASRKSVSAAEVNGTFRMNFKGKFKGSSNEMKILALGGGKLHIEMDLLYPYFVKGELSANMGQLDGEASITDDTAIYESAEFGKCKITVKFVKAGTIKISQDGTDFDCGFGHNVRSDGTYLKVSSRKPKFEGSK